ncbi:serine hydrolase [Patescibacteria group bacterium]|nr:serine hydrolase [Patescibacteria group bacterium]
MFLISQLLPLDYLSHDLTYQLDASNQATITTTILDTGLIEQPPRPEKMSQSLGIETTAKSALVLDPDSHTILFQKDPVAIRPIASITKLMTALVFLENNPGWETEIEIIKADQASSGNVDLKVGDKVTVSDLFYSSLVGSANNATEALVRSTELSRDQFIEIMNQRAQAMGLDQTVFEDLTGLSANNLSSAKDIARLASFAFNNSDINGVTVFPEYEFKTINTKRSIKVTNTNKLFGSLMSINGAKTGFTNEAGYCMVLRSKGNGGHQVISVVLGSDSSDERFQEIKGLVSWAFENWSWLNN